MEDQKFIEYFEEQKKYVIKHQVSLRKIYGKNYIAIKDLEIIDNDPDQFNLAKKIDERFKDKLVLISTIEDIVNPRIVNLDSPEVEH